MICAGLHIDSRELDRWAAGLWADERGADAKDIDLADLSALYRWTSLARATKLSADDALTLRRLAGVGIGRAAAADPFGEIGRFLAAWDTARDGGLGVDAIVAVLGCDPRPAAEPATAAAEQARATLQGELPRRLATASPSRHRSETPQPVQREAEQALVVRGFALLLGLAPATVDRLLFGIVPRAGVCGGAALLDPGFVAGVTQAEAARVARGMQRAALAIKAWGLDDEFDALCDALAGAGSSTALDTCCALPADERAAYEDLAAASAMAGVRDASGPRRSPTCWRCCGQPRRRPLPRVPARPATAWRPRWTWRGASMGWLKGWPARAAPRHCSASHRPRRR